MLTVDLNAPTIPLDQRVWRLFPGTGYQFLDSFLEQGVGFLDFPGFIVPDDKLSDAEDLIPRVALSQRVREQLLQDGPGAIIEVDVKKYQNTRHTQPRGRLRQALINLLEEAKVSDLVILPEPMFMGKIWIGQIANDSVIDGFFNKKYGKTPIPARSIRWIGSYRENTLSTSLSTSLRHPHPFNLLEKSLRLEVLSLAFGSFIYGDMHAATVYNDVDFLDTDAALLGTISRLASAACQSLDNYNFDIDKIDLVDILIRTPPIEYTCTQEVDIHSPGFNRYISGKIVPLVIAATLSALVGMSANMDSAAVAQDIRSYVIMNSSVNADPQCTARVSEASKLVFNILGLDKTLALCDAARKAQERGGLRSTAKPAR